MFSPEVKVEESLANAWLDAIVPIFRAAKPMMDMMNAVIDDYE